MYRKEKMVLNYVVYIAVTFIRKALSETPSQIELKSSNYSVVFESKGFVDKSMLMYDLFTPEESYVVITAPRKFGKTTNLDMIRKFAEYPADRNQSSHSTQAYRMYKQLKIWTMIELFQKHFASHPVVLVDLKAHRIVDRYPIALEYARDLIHACYLQHAYLNCSGELSAEQQNLYYEWSTETEYVHFLDKDIFIGIRELVKMVQTYYKKKVVLLVDNYDSYVTSAMYRAKPTDLNDITKLVIRMITGLQKYVSYEVVTGELYLQGDSMHNFGDFKICKFLGNHIFVDSFGFTEYEVEYLYEQHLSRLSREDIASARMRYHGYTSKNNLTIFCPYSVLSFIHSGKADNYWPLTGEITYFKEAMDDTYLRLKLEEALGFAYISAKAYNDGLSLLHLTYLRNLYSGTLPCLEPDVVFAHLLETGYMSYAYLCEHHGKYTLRIASVEIQACMLEKIFDIYKYHGAETVKGIFNNITEIANVTYSKLNDGEMAPYK